MTCALDVLAPGPSTSVQDLGRFGFQHAGVSESGALDSLALRLANLLVGNDPREGALEALYIGPALRVNAGRVRVAFAGAGGDVEAMEPGGAWRPAPFGQSFMLNEGASVRCRARGCATIYMAVEGGFDIAPVLGSVSTDVRSGLGGVQGRALKAGDSLPLRRGAVEPAVERRLAAPLRAPGVFRVLPGPQDDYFDEAALQALWSGEFVVGHGANRMGLRLEGPAIRPVRGFDITSDALAPGSIQISGDGKPIVLLADRQTTGGYPKIGTVISADVPALGRTPSGARIRFARVDREEALKARRDMLHLIARLENQIEPVRPAKPRETLLLEANLISGVIDARVRP
ncbi:MAG: biotin-dependent carboxyltransferase family protein [Beijerinckiaceae bacterium]